jgi:hypothetical protein
MVAQMDTATSFVYEKSWLETCQWPLVAIGLYRQVKPLLPGRAEIVNLL